jgi:hypothetical protein
MRGFNGVRNTEMCTTECLSLFLLGLSLERWNNNGLRVHGNAVKGTFIGGSMYNVFVPLLFHSLCMGSLFFMMFAYNAETMSVPMFYLRNILMYFDVIWNWDQHRKPSVQVISKVLLQVPVGVAEFCHLQLWLTQALTGGT